MSVPLRVLLVAVSLLTLIFVVRRIRKSGLKIGYSLFWITLSGLILVLSIFPGIAIKMASVLQIMSPVNFIYLFMIFILLLHSFYLTTRISHLEDEIQNLTQELADDFMCFFVGVDKVAGNHRAVNAFVVKAKGYNFRITFLEFKLGKVNRVA